MKVQLASSKTVGNQVKRYRVFRLWDPTESSAILNIHTNTQQLDPRVHRLFDVVRILKQKKLRLI